MEELIEVLNEIQLCNTIEQAHLLAKAAIFKLQATETNPEEFFDVDDYLSSTETI